MHICPGAIGIRPLQSHTYYSPAFRRQTASRAASPFASTHSFHTSDTYIRPNIDAIPSPPDRYRFFPASCHRRGRAAGSPLPPSQPVKVDVPIIPDSVVRVGVRRHCCPPLVGLITTSPVPLPRTRTNTNPVYALVQNPSPVPHTVTFVISAPDPHAIRDGDARYHPHTDPRFVGYKTRPRSIPQRHAITIYRYPAPQFSGR